MLCVSAATVSTTVPLGTFSFNVNMACTSSGNATVHWMNAARASALTLAALAVAAPAASDAGSRDT